MIVASISGKLIDNGKSRWLFSVGLILGQLTQNCWQVDKETQNSVEKIKNLLQSKPENISTTLVSDLEELILLTENKKLNIYTPTEGNQIYQLLKNLEQKFLFVGT